jgi:hypothetical protein
MPPQHVVVKACRFNDVACLAPEDTFVDVGQTGHVQVTLPSGFTGYFEIESESLPAVLYVTKPISRNTLNRDVPVLTDEALALTAAVTSIDVDRELGVVLLEAVNCAGVPAGGVQFKLRDAEADPFYLVDQIPNVDATLSVYDPNNNTADGGFINVPVGAHTFSAHWGVDGPELQAFNAQIRAKTITFIDMTF